MCKCINENDFIDKYKASGILFNKNINNEQYYLFIIEKRDDNNPVVHIIGGKKEIDEYPSLTATRETWEETYGLISKVDCQFSLFSSKKYWYYQGKYILFITKCPLPYYNIMEENSAEKNMLVWISEKELVTNIINDKKEFISNNGITYKYSNFLINILIFLIFNIKLFKNNNLAITQP